MIYVFSSCIAKTCGELCKTIRIPTYAMLKTSLDRTLL